MRTPARFALAILLSAPGCVTKAAHESTLKELAAANDANESARLDNAELQRRLGQQQKETLDLRTALAEQEELVAELTVERAKLSQSLARQQEQLATLEKRAGEAERELGESLKSRARLKDSVERMSAALAMLAARQATAEIRVAEYRDMLGRFRRMIDAGTLDVRVSEGRMVLTLPMDVLFATGSTRMSRDGHDAVSEVGATLATMSNKQFQVEGHTDDVPIKNERFASNWELAAGRSLVVVHALLAAGMAPTQLSAASYSEYKPRAANSDDQSRAKNRRIEIVVVPDLSQLPGVHELERAAQGS